MTSLATAGRRREQLAKERRRVDFDTYDVTVDELIRRVSSHRIDIAPAYQRQFRWDDRRQSALVESVLLGIPVPPLFMATNQEIGVQNRWEVVDGLQRLLTLVNFAGDDATRKAASLSSAPLALAELDKLTSFDGCSFSDLPDDIQSTLFDRPLKVVVLNDKSDLQVRYDLFERLNTGGIRLTPHEIRECVYRGEFLTLLTELSQDPSFHTVVRLPAARWKDGTPQDYVLRFFAFTEHYQRFDHLVDEFLRNFVADAAKSPEIDRRQQLFHRTFEFLAACFPEGVKTRKGATPVNLFEGLSAGAALALQRRPHLSLPHELGWVRSEELRRLTTGATNSRARVRGRVEFCRDRFLALAA
jgi:Protein of unknown function DUF262